jgi:hypothetical protein
MSETEKTRAQIIEQCRAVCHMATALSHVYSDYQTILLSPNSDSIMDMVGNRTASIMETLGDILNGMDAVTEEDDWLKPVFEEAQRRWPQPHH